VPKRALKPLSVKPTVTTPSDVTTTGATLATLYGLES
jgi:hypothetical protein